MIILIKHKTSSNYVQKPKMCSAASLMVMGRPAIEPWGATCPVRIILGYEDHGDSHKWMVWYSQGPKIITICRYLVHNFKDFASNS